MSLNFDERPILVFWEMTKACQLACKHCRADAIAEPLPGELDTSEGEKLIRSLVGFGSPPPVLIFTGGDPFMRKDLWDLAALATELGLPIGFAPGVTPLLNHDTMEKMKQVGAKTVSISMDGARPETHEGIRGIDDHLRLTKEAISTLASEGFTVQVNSAVMRHNVEEFADLAALVRDLGAKIWEVFFLILVGRGAELAQLTAAENEDFAHFLYDSSRYGFIVRTVEGPFFRRVAAWRRDLPDGVNVSAHFNLGPLYTSLHSHLEEVLGPPILPSRAQTQGTRDGKGIVFVSHNGEVYPSGFFPMALGNVRVRSLVDIYRDNEILKAIRRADFSGRCGVCEYRDSCGGSRARAFASYLDALAEDPGCAYQPGSVPLPAGV
jgi:radical SAM protein